MIFFGGGGGGGGGGGEWGFIKLIYLTDIYENSSPQTPSNGSAPACIMMYS
jgi:hypothetical protein